jgi:autotransporter-associated beta strand protein
MRLAAAGLAMVTGAIFGGATLLAAPPAATGTGWDLVFADEFDGTSADTLKWNIASPTWTMPNSDSTASADQVSVGDGVLTLGAIRNSASSFSSGSVSTYQKYTWTSGYFEARILLPTTPGSWPAFWGLYTGWPPEADIMEFPLTTDGGTNGYSNTKYSTNFHYTNSSGANAAGAGVVDPSSAGALNTGYHKFGMHWVDNTSVTFYFDDVQVSSFTNSTVAQMVNMYLMLDYAVGGWPGTPSTAQWPLGFTDQTKVDYVRVWQQRPSGSSTTSTWKINGSGTWTTAGNWTGIVPTYGGQQAVFGRVGTATTASVDWTNSLTVGGITFSGSTTTTAYSLVGDSLQLAGSGGTANAYVETLATSQANQTISSRLDLYNTTEFRNNMTGGQLLALNGVIVGDGDLVVNGAGTVQFSNNNTYTGDTYIGTTATPIATALVNRSRPFGTTGMLYLGISGNANAALIQIQGNRDVPNTIRFAGRGASATSNATPGVQNLGGSNVFNGTINLVQGGVNYIVESNAGLLTLSGFTDVATPGIAVQVGAGVGGSRVFTLQGAGDGSVAGVIQNGSATALSIVKSGAGTWTLTSPNTYTGITTISSGTLRLAPGPAPVARYTFDNVSGSTAVNDGNGGTAMNGTLANGATIVSGGKFGNAVSLSGGASVNINNPILDMGNTANWTVSAWVKTTTAGSSILTKGSGTSWTTGNTIFYLGDGTAAGSGGIPSSVRYGGGFFQGATSATSVTDGNWHLVTYVNNAGTYAIYVDGAVQSLSSGNSSFSNSDVGAVVRLGITTDNVASDGTVNFTGLLDDVQFYNQALSPAQIAGIYQSQTVAGSLPSTANVAISSGAALEVNGVSQTFSNAISGSGGSLVKTGTGTLTLAGVNTFSGTTALNSGTLAVTGSLSAGGTLTTATGTVLMGAGAINASTTINGTHQPGSSVGTQTFGTLAYGGTAHLAWELGGNTVTSGSFDKVTASGAVTIGSGAVIDVVLNGTGSGVNLTDSFWTQSHSWPILTAASISGTFALGNISADPAGRPVSNYGALALQPNGTAVTLVFTPYTPQQNWQRTNFGANWNNAAMAGDMVDGDQDGLSNLLEYALGSDPNIATGAASQVAVASGKLTISFTRNTAATDLTLSVVGADDPAGPWTEIARSTGGAAFSVIANGATVSESSTGATRAVQVGDVYLTSDPTHPKRFLKVQASR